MGFTLITSIMSLNPYNNMSKYNNNNNIIAADMCVFSLCQVPYLI